MSASMLHGAALAPLPHLSAPCRKCGSDQRTLVCVPAAGDSEVDDAPLVRLDPREHLQVTCSACGFTWAAAPLDAGDQ